jgi:prophage tail gpP-like protein
MSTRDELILLVGGYRLSGWQSVRISRGIERCPSDFTISLTERFPHEVDALTVNAGDPCKVLIAGNANSGAEDGRTMQTLLTGYIDLVEYTLDAGRHSIAISGRSKCADLIDASAEWPNGQISGADAVEIATKLAAPYGITVSAPGDRGVRVLQTNLNIGESAFDIIERICRYGALLAYDGPDGNLILTRASSEQARGGFTQGRNVQAAHVTYRKDGRFSDYGCFLQSMDVLGDTGEGGNLMATASDPGVKRHRTKYLITEAPSGGVDFAHRRVTWEANRRIGRSMQLHLTTDTWRDAGGVLWEPNTLAALSLPAMKLGTGDEPRMWLITEVVYRREEGTGTTCDLTIMPPEAFELIPLPQTPDPIAELGYQQATH